jgi:hypothetical protein
MPDAPTQRSRESAARVWFADNLAYYYFRFDDLFDPLMVNNYPASAPMRQKGLVEEGSDCLKDQAGSGCHGRRSRRIALRIVISLQATATRARTLGRRATQRCKIIFSRTSLYVSFPHTRADPCRYCERQVWGNNGSSGWLGRVTGSRRFQTFPPSFRKGEVRP